MASLNEAERRRPDFRPGVPLKLADGQVWELAKPAIRFACSDKPEGFRVSLSLCSYAENEWDYFRLPDALDAAYGEHERVLSAVRAGENVDTGPASSAVIKAELAVAIACLRRNYNLSIEEIGGLIRFSYDPADADAFRIREEVLNVAMRRDTAPAPAPQPAPAAAGEPEDSAAVRAS